MKMTNKMRKPKASTKELTNRARRRIQNKASTNFLPKTKEMIKRKQQMKLQQVNHQHLRMLEPKTTSPKRTQAQMLHQQQLLAPQQRSRKTSKSSTTSMKNSNSKTTSTWTQSARRTKRHSNSQTMPYHLIEDVISKME